MICRKNEEIETFAMDLISARQTIANLGVKTLKPVIERM